ncbi:hypothetical protein K458DRAFT_427247 [Lentithecium fluviatile CBS 122367]|uniref:N-acetyltransferase domain-containing protein n=1 Tax=Lentithecium fluviatile CBS 122367 TaxID=1168545 RepID=A0A6G1JIY2_9PLEO|nr:hypothetical protein K458DRAFT_427247 [Lentithecium fluviatile CBS 122367]
MVGQGRSFRVVASKPGESTWSQLAWQEQRTLAIRRRPASDPTLPPPLTYIASVSYRTHRGREGEYRFRAPPNHLRVDPDVAEDIVYYVVPERLIQQREINCCALYFSKYFGIWGRRAAEKLGPEARHDGELIQVCLKGTTVSLSAADLRWKYLPKGANNILITAVTRDHHIIGHCFVSQWHRGARDRVWWITQLVVRPDHRDQLKATRMLRALVEHYDIGRATLPTKDHVGILSPHPYAILTVLRVFGRGVEVLPSRPDWVDDPKGFAHVPLARAACLPLLQESPVPHLRNARPSRTSLTAYTRSWIDHTESRKALKRIMLDDGCEYLCVLEYKWDSQYDYKPQPPGPCALATRELPDRPVHTTQLVPREPGHFALPVRYVQLDQALSERPEYIRRNPGRDLEVSGAVLYEFDTGIYAAAQEVLKTNLEGVIASMDPKWLPSELHSAYVARGLYGHFTRWCDLKEWLRRTDESDEEFERNLWVRVPILQAVHFLELSQQDYLRSIRTKQSDPGMALECDNSEPNLGDDGIDSRKEVDTAVVRRS